MAIAAQFNASTLKASYVAGNNTAQIVTGLPPACSCEYTNDCPDCFDANQTPRYLAAIINGIKLCVDDSEPFTGKEGCLEVIGSLQPGLPLDCYWYKQIIIFEEPSIWVSYVINEDDTTEVYVSDNLLTESPDYYFISFGGGAYGTQFVYNNDTAKVNCGGNRIGYEGTVTIGYPCA